ncbi:MAG: hypothetical protein ABI723_03825 [Bacteroidia bacterium]
MNYSQLLFIAGTIPFMYLGMVHVIIALKDIKDPRAFTPINDNVRKQMMVSPLRFTDKTTMWKAWLGFNISHGLGAFVFGLFLQLLVIQNPLCLIWLTPLAVCISAIYLWLSLKFWFNKPTIGIATGLLFLLLAWIIQLLFN